MPPVGTIESLWRYPVKSMRGEQLAEAFMGFPEDSQGRIFPLVVEFVGAVPGFDWLT